MKSLRSSYTGLYPQSKVTPVILHEIIFSEGGGAFRETAQKAQLFGRSEPCELRGGAAHIASERATERAASVFDRLALDKAFRMSTEQRPRGRGVFAFISLFLFSLPKCTMWFRTETKMAVEGAV